MKHSYQNGVVTNTVHRYKITHGFYYAKTYEHKHKISSRRADNIRPYRIVQMIAILRLGIFSFLLYKLSSRIGCRGTRLQSYLNIESHARAFLVFYCTNYLHELTAEALGYRIAKTITMLRSGIKVFDLKKLSSRMKILTFGGNWIII